MAQKQAVLNITANVFSFLVSACISFFLTPYLVRVLGADAYGFFPMASYIFSYSTIITSALNIMAGRFIAIEVHQGNTNRASSFFNTVFFADLVIAIFLLVLSLVLTVRIDTILNIPDHLIRDVKILFLLVFAGSILTLIFSVYTTATFVTNRVDLEALTTIVSKFCRLLLTLGLFTLLPPNISYLGVIFLCVTVILIVLQVILKRRLLPNIHLNIHDLNSKTLRTLLKSGSWVSLSQFNNSLLVGIDLIIANMFLGAAAAGILAIAKTIPGLLSTFSTAIAAALVPSLVRKYTVNKGQFVSGLKKTFAVLSLSTPIIVGGFISLGYDFYKLWIPGENPTVLFVLSILTMLPTITTCGINTLEYTFIITDNLKLDALSSLGIALASILVVLILLTTNPALGIYAIAGVSAVLEVGKKVIFVPVYAAKCNNSKWYTFYPDYMKSWLCIVVTTITGFILRTIITIDSWMSLIFVAILVCIISFPINTLITTSKESRRTIKDMVLGRRFTF